MSNPNVNRIDSIIATGDMTAIATGLSSALSKLSPLWQALLADENSSLFSVAEENLVFANEAMAQGTVLNASFPPIMQAILVNMANDATLYNQTHSIENGNFAQLKQALHDIQRLAAHEFYVGALAVYKFIEAGAALGMPGYQEAYDILKARFANQGGGSPTQPTP